jgi:Glycine-zipper domain
MKTYSAMIALSGALLLGGCVSVPTGPSVMVLPGAGKNFTEFQTDDADCRQFAYYQIGGSTADQAAADAGVRSAIVGTVIGAAAGAVLGGHQGAGVGAGTGLLVGSMAGTGAAQRSAYGTQRQYDHAYVQCMYSKGQRVPVAASRMQAPNRPLSAPATVYAPPPPDYYAAPPPPPPGNPPSPPR